VEKQSAGPTIRRAIRDPEGRKRWPQRGFGIDAGLFEVPDDFDDPLPPEIMPHFTKADCRES
jgi:hypothetical protein